MNIVKRLVYKHCSAILLVHSSTVEKRSCVISRMFTRGYCNQRDTNLYEDPSRYELYHFSVNLGTC